MRQLCLHHLYVCTSVCACLSSLSLCCWCSRVAAGWINLTVGVHTQAVATQSGSGAMEPQLQAQQEQHDHQQQHHKHKSRHRHHHHHGRSRRRRRRHQSSDPHDGAGVRAVKRRSRSKDETGMQRYCAAEVCALVADFGLCSISERALWHFRAINNPLPVPTVHRLRAMLQVRRHPSAQPGVHHQLCAHCNSVC